MDLAIVRDWSVVGLFSTAQYTREIIQEKKVR